MFLSCLQALYQLIGSQLLEETHRKDIERSVPNDAVVHLSGLIRCPRAAAVINSRINQTVYLDENVAMPTEPRRSVAICGTKIEQ